MDKAQAARGRRGGNGNGHGGAGSVAEAPPMEQTAEVISTGDLRDLLAALQAMKVGDFSVRLPGDRVGMFGKIADAFNDIVADNQVMAVELERVGEAVGREGRTRQRV